MNMYMITVTLRVLKSERKNAKMLAGKTMQAFVGQNVKHLKGRFTYDNQCELEELVKHYANDHENRVELIVQNSYFGMASRLQSKRFKRGNELTLAIRNAICTGNGMAEVIEVLDLTKTKEVE